jgi:transposase-like protein
VESINAQLRKVTKKRGAFPTEQSVRKKCSTSPS